MEDLLRFLETYEVWIYLILGGVGIFSFRKLVISWQDWRTAIFGLERENAQRKVSASLSIVILLALFAVGEFILVSFVSPVYPKSVLATPTLDLLATATVTLPADMTPEAEEQSDVPTPEAGAAQGCIPGQVEWLSPVDGDEISESVDLQATVNVDNLGFFKYEFSQPGNTVWTTIAAGNERVFETVLGTWNVEQLTPGDYLLRLVVTDNQNQVMPACQIAIRIVAQQP